MRKNPSMASPHRGEVWMVDLGMAAKVRPCLVLSVPAADEDRALTTIVPHTTAIRGTRFEVSFRVGFLHHGGFDAQNLATIPHAKLVRKLGTLTTEQLSSVESVVRKWLGFEKL
jgi:mRNA interferase MazF